MRLPTAVIAALTVTALTGCTPTEPAPVGSHRAVGIGYETVTDEELNPETLREQLDTAGISAVNVSVGRPEFLAAPLADAEQQWSSSTRRAAEAGHDRVAELVDTLTQDSGRTVTLTLDVLAPLLIQNDSTGIAAGHFSDGQPSDSFPSATALTGNYGDRIAETCAAVAKEYHPDNIALTELIGEAFFSAADEKLYAQTTGAPGFPRSSDGEIDTTDASVTQWQSQVISSVVSRCVTAAEPFDVGVDVDVRVNWDNPGADRTDSGHLYDDLLATGANLTLWAYTGTGKVPADAVGEIARGIRDRYDADTQRRITISLGLWGEGEETVSPDEFALSLATLAQSAGTELSILVTPVSLMEPAHWEELAKSAVK